MTDARGKILAAACELYLAEGLDGFSMRKLGRRVGVTAPALYRHFASREEVLLALVSESHRVLGQYLYRALSGRTPNERMTLAGEGYLDFALENPMLYDILHLSPSVLGVDVLPENVADQACATGQFWMDRVRESVDAGLLRPCDPEELGVTLWAHAHGLISLYLRGSLEMSEATFREVYRGSGARIFQGLGTPHAVALWEAAAGGAVGGVGPGDGPGQAGGGSQRFGDLPLDRVS
jgi:AcrR family transcriptional regulator